MFMGSESYMIQAHPSLKVSSIIADGQWCWPSGTVGHWLTTSWALRDHTIHHPIPFSPAPSRSRGMGSLLSGHFRPLLLGQVNLSSAYSGLVSQLHSKALFHTLACYQGKVAVCCVFFAMIWMNVCIIFSFLAHTLELFRGLFLSFAALLSLFIPGQMR